MAQSRTFSGPAEALASPVPKSARAGTRHIRIVVIISLLLIAGSFASAGAIQMRLDRLHAMTQAAAFGDRRAQEIATDLSAILDRYEALGTAFANAAPSAETSAALSEAGGSGLRNIAVLDGTGQLQFEMTGAPEGLLPLPPDALASNTRAVVPSADARTMALVFRVGPRIVAMQIDPTALLPPASMEDSLIATPGGKVVALGADWNDVPAMAPLALDGAPSAARIVDVAGGSKLISLRQVPGWPLSVGSSVAVGDALGAWYGALPLYLFFIFGPALAGAGLAVGVRARIRAPRAHGRSDAHSARHRAGRRATARAPRRCGTPRHRGGALQDRIHRAYEPRTAHAAERHHRLLRSDRAGFLRPARPSEICRICA